MDFGLNNFDVGLDVGLEVSSELIGLELGNWFYEVGLELFVWFRVCLSCLIWENLSFGGGVLGASSIFG